MVIPPGEGPTLRLDVTKRRSSWRAEASVTDPEGRALAGVEIGLAATGADREFDVSARTMTDDEGRAILEGELPAGRATLLVAAAVVAPGEVSPRALEWTLMDSRGNE